MWGNCQTLWALVTKNESSTATHRLEDVFWWYWPQYLKHHALLVGWNPEEYFRKLLVRNSVFNRITVWKMTTSHKRSRGTDTTSKKIIDWKPNAICSTLRWLKIEASRRQHVCMPVHLRSLGNKLCIQSFRRLYVTATKHGFHSQTTAPTADLDTGQRRIFDIPVLQRRYQL